MVKQCFKCKKVKEFDQFYKHPEMGDGRLNKCKECSKKDTQENYSKKRDQYALYEKERWKRPERKAAAIVYQKRRRQKFKGKERARAAVTRALRIGQLVRGVCEVCGSEKSQAHHPDYRSPLRVKWLCRTHHLLEHNKIAY